MQSGSGKTIESMMAGCNGFEFVEWRLHCYRAALRDSSSCSHTRLLCKASQRQKERSCSVRVCFFSFEHVIKFMTSKV
jgi:hypothetical protein